MSDSSARLARLVATVAVAAASMPSSAVSPYDHGPGKVHRLVSTDTPPVVIHGLPMIGFMANDYVNGTLMVDGRNVLSNYSATSVHRYTVRME